MLNNIFNFFNVDMSTKKEIINNFETNINKKLNILQDRVKVYKYVNEVKYDTSKSKFITNISDFGVLIDSGSPIPRNRLHFLTLSDWATLHNLNAGKVFNVLTNKGSTRSKGWIERFKRDYSKTDVFMRGF